MIDPSVVEDFRNIAEIGITIAGFAAIVSVVQRAEDAEIEAVRRSALVSLLGATLPLVLLALLPVWLRHGIQVEEHLWRICFGVYVIEQLFIFIVFTISGRGIRSTSTKFLVRLVRYLTWVLVPIGFALILVAFLCALGFFSQYYSFIYQGSLLYFLVIASVTFSCVIALASSAEYRGSSD